MKHNRWIGVIGIFMLLFFGLFAGFKTEVFLWGSLLVLGIVSGFYYFFLPADLPCKLTLPAVGKKKQKVTGYFHVMHPGLLPIFYGRAYGKVCNHLMKEELPLILDVGLLGKEEGIAPFEITPAYMGMIEVRIETIEIYGLLGCKKKRIPVKLQEEMMIFPDTEEIFLDMDVPLPRKGEGEEIRYNRHGFDPSMYYGARPYEEGDSLKNIHWKLTGKTEDYMVRELGEQAEELPTLFLETFVTDTDAKRLDGLLEKYISVSQHLAEENIRHRLLWKESLEGNWKEHRVGGLPQLDEAFDMLFRIDFTKEKEMSFYQLSEEELEEGRWIIIHTFSELPEKERMENLIEVDRFTFIQG